MGAAAVPLLLAGGAVSAFGAIQQGNATNSADKYNASIADNNATIAAQNATWAGQAGEQQAAMSEQKTRATVGSIKANQGAGGLDVNTGSAVNVRASAAELGQLDATTIRSNAARTAYGYQVQQASDKAQSQLDIYEGKQAQVAGYIGAGTSLLTAGAKAGEFSSPSTGMIASDTPTWGNPNYTTSSGTIAGGI